MPAIFASANGRARRGHDKPSPLGRFSVGRPWRVQRATRQRAGTRTPTERQETSITSTIRENPVENCLKHCFSTQNSEQLYSLPRVII